MLVGTSLIVIIPEGVETLYTASADASIQNKRAFLLESRRVALPESLALPFTRDATRRDAGVDEIFVPLSRDLQTESNVITKIAHNPDMVASVLPRVETTGVANGLPDGDTAVEDPSEDSETDERAEPHDPHAWVGISLIMGFILMYLIDNLPRHAIKSAQPQRFHVSLNQFSLTNRTRSISESNEPPIDNMNDPPSTSRPSSTTIGLVIHAAADGIALGASSTNSSSNLSFIIFIALMIHKAPAAFGLTTVLLKQGLSKRTARAHLIVFSLAAPLGALFTWFAIHLLGFSSGFGESASTEFTTGVLLLFSGGTFLYVAMHTMQENGAPGHDHSESHGMNGYNGVPSDNVYRTGPSPVAIQPSSPALLDNLVTVGGMLLPLLTQFGHAH